MYGGQPKEKKEQVNVLFPSSLAKQKSPIQKKEKSGCCFWCPQLFLVVVNVLMMMRWSPGDEPVMSIIKMMILILKLSADQCVPCTMCKSPPQRPAAGPHPLPRNECTWKTKKSWRKKKPMMMISKTKKVRSKCASMNTFSISEAQEGEEKMMK